MFKQANTRKHVSEHSWSSVRVVLSTLGHQAHLAQSYFSLIFIIHTFLSIHTIAYDLISHYEELR